MNVFRDENVHTLATVVCLQQQVIYRVFAGQKSQRKQQGSLQENVYIYIHCGLSLHVSHCTLSSLPSAFTSIFNLLSLLYPLFFLFAFFYLFSLPSLVSLLSLSSLSVLSDYSISLASVPLLILYPISSILYLFSPLSPLSRLPPLHICSTYFNVAVTDLTKS